MDTQVHNTWPLTCAQHKNFINVSEIKQNLSNRVVHRVIHYSVQLAVLFYTFCIYLYVLYIQSLWLRRSPNIATNHIHKFQITGVLIRHYSCTYIVNTCRPTANPSPAFLVVARHLRSADRGHLDFPRVKLASYGGRSFAYAGPSNWNSLPAHYIKCTYLYLYLYLRDNSLSLSFLSATSKPFSSLSTRLAHAARLGFFFLQKTRYINSLLLVTSLPN